jgi:dolichol-phosphate mannosyltransferase
MARTETGPAWLVVPTYNEAENVEPFVAAARAKLPASAQILIVDDNSPDGTGARAEELAERHDNVSVLHRPRKEGIGPAYVAGFRRALAAGAELVLEMDCDFSHDPAYLPRLLAASQRADLVLGSRYVDGGAVSDWGPLRRAISRGGSAYARLLLGVDVQDLTGGFKCFRRPVLEPIVFRDRRVGASKMDRSILAEAVWQVPQMRFANRQRREPRTGVDGHRYTF